MYYSDRLYQDISILEKWLKKAKKRSERELKEPNYIDYKKIMYLTQDEWINYVLRHFQENEGNI